MNRHIAQGKWPFLRLFAFAFAGLLGFLALAHSAAAGPAASVQAELTPSRSAVYVNETFRLTLTVRIAGVSLHKNMELSGLPGPNTLELGPFEELPVERKIVGGSVMEIRRSQCSARAPAAGRIELKPMLRVLVVTRRFPGSVFFPEEETYAPYEVAAVPCSIECRNLPPPPDNAIFSGAVGDFTLDVKLSSTNVAPGSLVKVVSRITGSGYLAGAKPPAIPTAPHLRIYDPRLSFSNAQEAVFECDVVPQSSDVRTIPSVSFTFFNPAMEKYVTLSKGPFELQFVEPTGPARGIPVYTPPARSSAAACSERRSARLLSTSRRFWEWAVSAAAASGIIAAMLASLSRKSKPGLSAAAALTARMCALAAAGCIAMAIHARRMEKALATVTRREQALFAPRRGAEGLFPIPAGSQVRIAERHEEWVRVIWNRRGGWIPADSLAAANPDAGPSRTAR